MITKTTCIVLTAALIVVASVTFMTFRMIATEKPLTVELIDHGPNIILGNQNNVVMATYRFTASEPVIVNHLHVDVATDSRNDIKVDSQDFLIGETEDDLPSCDDVNDFIADTGVDDGKNVLPLDADSQCDGAILRVSGKQGSPLLTIEDGSSVQLVSLSKFPD